MMKIDPYLNHAIKLVTVSDTLGIYFQISDRLPRYEAMFLDLKGKLVAICKTKNKTKQ